VEIRLMQIRSRTLPPALPPRTRTLLPRTRTLPPTLPGRRKIDRSSRPEYQKLIDGDSIYTCTNFTSEREGGGSPARQQGGSGAPAPARSSVAPSWSSMALGSWTSIPSWNAAIRTVSGSGNAREINPSNASQTPFPPIPTPKILIPPSLLLLPPASRPPSLPWTLFLPPTITCLLTPKTPSTDLIPPSLLLLPPSNGLPSLPLATLLCQELERQNSHHRIFYVRFITKRCGFTARTMC